MNSHLAIIASIQFVVTAPQLATAPPQCDYGARHPNAPVELSQFEFLIGDFSVRLHAWINDAWSPPKPGISARWNGRYGLEGMAIIDEWYHPDPAQNIDAPRGINVRIYDPESKEWDMMWIETSTHQVQDLRAKIENESLVMWQVYPENPDFRAEFKIEDPDHWARITYKNDGNGKWEKQYLLKATRIACDKNSSAK